MGILLNATWDGNDNRCGSFTLILYCLTGKIFRTLVMRQEYVRAVALAFLGSMKVTNLSNR